MDNNDAWVGRMDQLAGEFTKTLNQKRGSASKAETPMPIPSRKIIAHSI
jgi:hypothetical protein